ncbi:hypothetical protein R6U77_09120 [Lysinibacillus louembei]|uniref:Lipoprotein n=1 Tax=Lysinibacillus louembei TaxID=1470088 RepID=A0ABZ0S3U7_9BACI|nr:hypothetical protein [Lysinibacillus louembei]WPK13803.1 hypothetical protein R6U77_09120 [Lysinibacillus louembei]
MSKLKILINICAACVWVASCSTSSPDWAYNFVVWNDFMYVVSDEYTENIGGVIGEVTKFSDSEGIYSGNFSNKLEEGTKYYEVEGDSTDVSIAIEEGSRYRIAYRNGEYKK